MDIGQPKRITEVEPVSLPLPEAIPAPDAEGHHESVDNLFARLREEREGAVIKAQRVLAEQDEAGAVSASAASSAVPEPAPPETSAGDDVSAEPTEEAGAEESTAADGDQFLLERRDERLEPVASDLVRRLKRVLQDEQNEILDRLRQSRGRSRAEDALPSAADQSARYREVALGPLAEAAAVGASLNGNGTAGDLRPRPGPHNEGHVGNQREPCPAQKRRRQPEQTFEQTSPGDHQEAGGAARGRVDEKRIAQEG